MSDELESIDGFRRSGRSHLAAAQHIAAGVVGAQDGAMKLGSAAYLSHVAVECVLKARILYKGDCATLDDLKRKLPRVYQELFRGVKGHDLGILAAKLNLPTLLKHEGKSWKDDPCWKRMTSSGRPYSLRYQAHDLDPSDAKLEIGRAAEITEAVLAGTKLIPRGKSIRGKTK